MRGGNYHNSFFWDRDTEEQEGRVADVQASRALPRAGFPTTDQLAFNYELSEDQNNILRPPPLFFLDFSKANLSEMGHPKLQKVEIKDISAMPLFTVLVLSPQCAQRPTHMAVAEMCTPF
ncbi:predicted protein [Histoplasma capsulatum G186AR]|uniref:Uncharacterized protein n=1 Tax=Ajellomyces capsulatus (strain G186AR / H82 / ATCC MYA-2454 / RMSCC 2432) TaxID=447093 RepID=C0NXE8_AJECG|nr:uncharacterized protein HCBG_08140 [Histoplasma capsulatum G186AR]EEH04014.1 predicted protein [Histoplasma capsulatum G186AR]